MEPLGTTASSATRTSPRCPTVGMIRNDSSISCSAQARILRVGIGIERDPELVEQEVEPARDEHREVAERPGPGGASGLDIRLAGRSHRIEVRPGVAPPVEQRSGELAGGVGWPEVILVEDHEGAGRVDDDVARVQVPVARHQAGVIAGATMAHSAGIEAIRSASRAAQGAPDAAAALRSARSGARSYQGSGGLPSLSVVAVGASRWSRASSSPTAVAVAGEPRSAGRVSSQS